jgi:hypothetical protein
MFLFLFTILFSIEQNCSKSNNITLQFMYYYCSVFNKYRTAILILI